MTPTKDGRSPTHKRGARPAGSWYKVSTERSPTSREPMAPMRMGVAVKQGEPVTQTGWHWGGEGLGSAGDRPTAKA